MRIRSEDRSTVLEIIANDPDEPCAGYRVSAIVRDAFSPFSGQNDGVHFSALDEFLKQLAKLIETREGSAILKMTEDCALEFFRWNARGDLGVRARITKRGFVTDSYRADRNCLEIEFKIETEFVNQMYEDFSNIDRSAVD